MARRFSLTIGAVSVLAGLLMQEQPSLVWDGTDTGSGNSVEIESGQTVRPNNDIDFYDHGSGSYRTLGVDSVRRYGSTVEIEGTDGDGNAVTLEMDAN